MTGNVFIIDRRYNSMNKHDGSTDVIYCIESPTGKHQFVRLTDIYNEDFVCKFCFLPQHKANMIPFKRPMRGFKN